MDNNPKVYIPKNTKINIDNKPLEPPKTRYEERKKILNQEAVKKNS